ncbi:MAG: hypothetical protein ACO1RX_01805 [Candidatus Sericytochromatia bacterium]
MKLSALILGLVMLGCSACQAPLQSPSPAVQMSRQSIPMGQLPLTAKVAADEADRLALQWAPGAALAHLLGQQITQAGVPHAQSGAWLFSYVDSDHPERALQIRFRVKQAPQITQVSSKQLPHSQPLEIRAWGLDSDRAITRARQMLPNVVLKQIELSARDERLVWIFGGQPLLDAMNGRPYESMR